MEGKTWETLIRSDRKDLGRHKDQRKVLLRSSQIYFRPPFAFFSDRGIKLISPETLRLLQDLLLVLVQLGPEDFLLRFFSK